MTDSSVEDFRCDVVGRAADGAFLFAREFEFGGETEVAKFDFHAVADEQVAELEISVDDSICVEVLECLDDLNGVAKGFEFGDALATLDELVEGLMRAEFEENVDVFMIFEDVLELDDVGVMQALVDFDFGYEFLPSTVLHERVLWDDLRGHDFPRFDVRDLEALCETSLSEQRASLVLFDCALAVDHLDFFFDNHWVGVADRRALLLLR